MYTVGEGSQFDYTVNTLRARALANGQISNVVLTFRMDSIAQEPNETFTLTLDPLIAPNPREGLFFRNTIEVTILDSDSKDDPAVLYVKVYCHDYIMGRFYVTCSLG